LSAIFSWHFDQLHRSVTRVIDPSFPACYKVSLRIAFLIWETLTRRRGASVPDAAKPQHFCLDAEARFRNLSRSIDGFQLRSLGTQGWRLCRTYLLDVH